MSGPLIKILSLPGTGKVGIATSKKIGGRPQRNRARRRVQESIRSNFATVDGRLDYVVVVHADLVRAPYERVREDVRALIEQANARWASELECS